MPDRINPKSAPQTRPSNPASQEILEAVRKDGVLGFLRVSKQTPESLKIKWVRQEAAIALLRVRGIREPPGSAVRDAEWAIMKAYEAGKLEGFTYEPKDTAFVDAPDGALQDERNVFHDHEYIGKDDLKGWNAATADHEIRSNNQASFEPRDAWVTGTWGNPDPKLQTGHSSHPATYSVFQGAEHSYSTYFKGYPERRSPLGPENYENGISGRLLIGSFIAGPHRWNGGYLRYGEPAWRNFLKAFNYLEDFQHGVFLSRLDVNVIKRVNALATTPEPGATASLFRAFGNFFRGEPAQPGELRNGKQVSRLETFTDHEVKILEAQGITVHSIPLPGGKNEGWLEYPPPEVVAQKLEDIVATLKHSLSQETPDVERAVAHFQKAFVALHPFGDGNGRTSRLIANRVLDEFDLPPIIFENQDRDLVATDDEWHTEVLRGIERSRRIISDTRSTVARLGWDSYLRKPELSASPGSRLSMNQRVAVDGLPFDLGADSFLYSPTGRPHLVLDNALVPIGQLEMYVLARRLKSMPPQTMEKMLSAITAETRALYGRLQAGYGQGEGMTVRSERNAVDADLSFSAKPHPKLAAMLVDAMDPTLATPEVLFEPLWDSPGPSGVMSQYAQRDLEYKLLLDAFTAQGFNGLADQLMGHRRKLFEIAKERINKVMQTNDLTSAQGPRGFDYHYERIMFENSPLRHPTLDAAIKADGDDEMVVYRGAYAIEGLLGMAPNNDPRQPSAREIAAFRAANGVVPDTLKTLNKITASAIGAEMICITTDLGLLHNRSFATGSKTITPRFGGLLGDGVIALASDTHIKGFGKIEAPIIDIERGKEENTLDVTLKKAVFVLKVPKKDLLPAHGTAGGGGPFVGEQEVEGLDKFGYSNVIRAFSHLRLGRIGEPAPPDEYAPPPGPNPSIATQPSSASEPTGPLPPLPKKRGDF